MVLGLVHALGQQQKSGPGGGGGGGGIPDLANWLALAVRTGPFWQDTARTVPATVTGNPVKAWDDATGNGKHWIWASGPVPTLAAGGGVDFPVGGAQLISAATKATTGWSWYVRSSDSNTADNGIVVTSNAATPASGAWIEPSVVADTYFGVGPSGGFFGLITGDSSAEKTRGMTVAAGGTTGFYDSTEASFAFGNIAVAQVAIGNTDATFKFAGTVRNVGLRQVVDDATARGVMRTYLATA